MSVADEAVLDDGRRLDALERLGLLDTEPEEQFDRITRLASLLLDTPISLISFVDSERQWFKSKVGLDVCATPREHAFCAHAISDTESEVFVVKDALLDQRFRANPLVTGDPHIRFYAGCVVRSPEGQPMGTLCVIDRQPRVLEGAQMEALLDLAALVEQEIRLSASLTVAIDADAAQAQKSLVLSSLSEGVVMHAPDGRVVEWNPAAEEVLGLSGEELSGRTSMDPRWRAIHEDETPWPGETHPAMVALHTGTAVENEVMGVHRPDGSLVWLRVTARPALDASGTTSGVVVAFDDITERRALQASISYEEAMARASVDSLEQGVVLADFTGEVLRANPAAVRILGYTPTELTELWRSNWITCDEFGGVLAVQERPITVALATGTAVHGRIVGWRRGDGELITLRVSVVPTGEFGDGFVVAFADVTAERRMLRELARFQYMFQNANDIVIVVDETGRVQEASESTQRILGYPDGWRHPGGILGMVHPDDLPEAAAGFSRLVSGDGDVDQLTFRVQTFAGDWRALECVAANLLNEPNVRGVVITARDATERIRLSAELAHRASHDELTDLPSRRMLEAKLTEALRRAREGGYLVALCFVDLDGFKTVNDTLGHGAGDELLVAVAERIRGAIRGRDVAARVGGDEFVVVFDPIANADEALATARRLRDAVVGGPADRPAGVNFGASVGLAISEQDDTPSTLLRRADLALYHAKSAHDSLVAFSDPLTGPRTV